MIAKCPVCFSDQLDVRCVVTCEEAAQHFVLREADTTRHTALVEHIRTLWGGNICTLQECRGCGFGFANPFVSGDVTFYNLAYDRSHYPRDKWEYQRTLDELAENKFHGQRVLEVGSGFGHFLDKIADVHVPKAGITALEFDDTSVGRMSDSGYSVLQEDVRSANLEPGFDAIFMFQVVEHMDKLDDLFARVSSLLSEGGELYIAVPNPKEIQLNEKSGSLLDMPPNHIGLWSEEAFRIIGARHDLQMEKYEVEPFSLKAFAKQDAVWSYLRTAQKAGTLANWERRRKAARFGKVVQALFVLAYMPRRLRVWLEAAKDGNLGGSAWVKYTRRAA